MPPKSDTITRNKLFFGAPYHSAGLETVQTVLNVKILSLLKVYRVSDTFLNGMKNFLYSSSVCSLTYI